VVLPENELKIGAEDTYFRSFYMSRKLILKSFSRDDLSDCQNCPFEKNNKIWGEGNFGGICFIGEAGGRDEDVKKRPFVGIAGKLLTEGLAVAKINRYDNWVTNVVTARPPNNNFHHPSTIKARECCLHGLKKEIAYVVSKGVRVLVPLGSNASRSIGLEFERMGQICGEIYRDSFFGFTDLWVIPNYHPSYLARNGGKDSPQWNYWIKNFVKVTNFLKQR